MQRFFVSLDLSVDIVLSDDGMIHQLIRVLRSRVGDQIVLFNGDGSESLYEILSLEKKSVQLRKIDHIFPNTEPKIQITLYQALPNKFEKIEYIIQKGVEIGIQKFVFFRSERSQKLIVSETKIQRLIQIARESVEQCGGLRLPEILFLNSFSEVSGQKDTGTHMVLDTSGKNTQISELDVHLDIGIWVGPEGGWSESEKIKMNEYGFIFAHFGERVMRTETAGGMIAFSLLYR